MSKFNGYFESCDVEGFTKEEKWTDVVMALPQNKKRIIERSTETILPQFFIGCQFGRHPQAIDEETLILALIVTNERK